MILYLVNIIHAFLPVALVTGMMFTLWRFINGRSIVPYISWAAAAGLFIGGVLYIVALSRLLTVVTETYLDMINIFSALLSTGAIFLSSKRQGVIRFIGWGGSIFFIVALTANATFSFLALISDQELSVASVLNTELILNLSGILAGIFVIGFVVFLTMRLSRTIGTGITLGFLSGVSALLILQWSAEAMLGMMRMEMVELTSRRLSFVARVMNFAQLFTYIHLTLLGMLSLIFFFKRPVLNPHVLSGMNSAERRKVRRKVTLELQWFKTAVISMAIITSSLLYYDLYASRPPRISTPIDLKPNNDGLIRVKIDEVKDGRLHRFSYVTDDGHVVRFFMINRSREHVKMGVVFDACVMCGGEMGYIQEGNEVICLACDTRIFIPSIGRSGGCNPIPLKHEAKGDYITVKAQDLDKGTRYFPR
jgi:uncharacterized membrane protein